MDRDKYYEKAMMLTGHRPGSAEMIAQALREAAAEAFEEAAMEASKERLMFLTKEEISDGILEDSHPTIRARKQMRIEIEEALRAKADALRAANTDGGKP